MYRNKSDEIVGLDDAMIEAIRALKGHEEHTPEYAKVVDQLTKLSAIKAAHRRDRISKDGLILALGNLLGILTIVKYEKANILTSKAVAFVGKFK